MEALAVGMAPDVRRDLCRQLRREGTTAERLFWEMVRNHRYYGVQFRRQHPVGRFVLDFYCPIWRVAVELDGTSHQGREARDTERDEQLAHAGIRVIRLANDDILRGDHDLETLIGIPDEATLERARASHPPKRRVQGLCPTPIRTMPQPLPKLRFGEKVTGEGEMRQFGEGGGNAFPLQLAGESAGGAEPSPLQRTGESAGGAEPSPLQRTGEGQGGATRLSRKASHGRNE